MGQPLDISSLAGPAPETPAPRLPYLPAMLRAYLLGDPEFAELCGGRCGTRAPATITTPFAIVQSPGGIPLDASAGTYSPLAQVNGWCAPGGQAEPEPAAWRIAAAAAARLSRARNQHWSAEQSGEPYDTWWSVHRIIDGPLPIRDDSRGLSNPVYGALVRAELRVHVR